MIIRPEQPADVDAIQRINTAAFETDAEARLVDALRSAADPFISLVAELDVTPVGHIVFSPATIEGHANINLLGLAPMAVLPQHQRQGIGAALVRAGLEACRERNAHAVIVLGHPNYYPKFGFAPASQFGIACEYEAPDEAFLLQQLTPRRPRRCQRDRKVSQRLRGSLAESLPEPDRRPPVQPPVAPRDDRIGQDDDGDPP